MTTAQIYTQTPQVDPDQETPHVDLGQGIDEEIMADDYLETTDLHQPLQEPLKPSELINYDPLHAEHMTEEWFRQLATQGNVLALRWESPHFHTLIDNCPGEEGTNEEVRGWFNQIAKLRGEDSIDLSIHWTGRELHHIPVSRIAQEFEDAGFSNGNAWLLANDAVLAACVSLQPPLQCSLQGLDSVLTLVSQMYRALQVCEEPGTTHFVSHLAPSQETDDKLELGAKACIVLVFVFAAVGVYTFLAYLFGPGDSPTTCHQLTCPTLECKSLQG